MDRLGYHAAFCPSTRSNIHDAVVNELRDCLRNAGACVLLEPVNVLPHAESLEQHVYPQGEINRPDLQVTHLDNTGKRYLVDVTTVDVSAKIYRAEASTTPEAGAAKAEARKSREYRSKVDGIRTKVLPAAVELSGRWGEGMIQLFKMAVALATKEGRNANGHFANRWKRRISLAARRAIIYQAHYALRKHLRDGNPDYDELSDDEPFDDREIHMNDI